MRTEIKLMHQRLQTTTVYVTHDQIEAMTLGDRVAVMKDGEVQQFGTPEEIYNNPANLFVASFIGSPPMNFVPVRLEAREGRVVARVTGDTGDSQVDLPDLDPALAGREAILGVRPEQIQSAHPADNAVPGILTRIQVVEPTGPDTLLYAEWNGTKVCCRVAPGEAPRAGDQVLWRIDSRRAVLFDPASGRRLS